MKKLIFILALLAIMALAGCSSAKDTTQSTTTELGTEIAVASVDGQGTVNVATDATDANTSGDNNYATQNGKITTVATTRKTNITTVKRTDSKNDTGVVGIINDGDLG